ncbi:uncharacterized protein E5676_scaffold142G001750 [Cucumis melo var. makuwa]|uniref:Uncharacterized protein n=1 Tax=Cucumis melo var. makuwa TaxID=1194695 RepID=A0A5D3DHP9_CUCMM|nr:uncharacterized protein E5676_scaffold142G001750 [Cucumis melo var. makuwa]
MNASDHSSKTHKKPRVWCDRCNKRRHTPETCWKLHGNPVNWKDSKPGERNSHLHTSNANIDDSNLFIKEQIDPILKLLKTTSSSSNPSVSLAQSSAMKKFISLMDQDLGETIGWARMIGGLYYFEKLQLVINKFKA